MKIIAARKVVVCEQPENKTSSGLLQASSEKGDKEPETGIVVEIGQGKPPVDIKKGDLIVYRRYTDNRIEVKGKEYNFVSFRDIMAVVQD